MLLTISIYHHYYIQIIIEVVVRGRIIVDVKACIFIRPETKLLMRLKCNFLIFILLENDFNSEYLHGKFLFICNFLF